MTADPFVRALERAWLPARELGALGSASIEELSDHAAGFIPAAFRVDAEIDCVDVGSGAGVPGILLARLLPRSRWTLIDSNERRCDLARQAVEATGLADRVFVRHARVDDLAHSPDGRSRFDFVVSRLFGGPAEVAECCLPLMRSCGTMVVSCQTDVVSVWRSADLSRVGGAYGESWGDERGSFVQVNATSGLEDRFPRRPSARERKPLFTL